MYSIRIEIGHEWVLFSVENASTKVLCLTCRNIGCRRNNMVFVCIRFIIIIQYIISVTLPLPNNSRTDRKQRGGNEAFCRNIYNSFRSSFRRKALRAPAIYIAFEKLNHAHNDDISSLLCVCVCGIGCAVFSCNLCWYAERTKASTFCLHYSMSADLMAYCYNHHNNVKRSIF